MIKAVLALFMPLDWVALALFLIVWLGYGWYVDRAARGARGLRGVTNSHRHEWGRQMVRRENRITDASLIGNLQGSASFYASTTTYIVAGLIAIAGTLDKLETFTSDLPFVRGTTRELLEVKVFLLVLVFIFAYFKFTWSLRQFNLVSVILGAAPPPNSPDDVLEHHAKKFGQMNSLAGDEFNSGIRAYYFGFAAMAWFVSAGLFMAFTIFILIVLLRRDFRSQTLHTLER